MNFGLYLIRRVLAILPTLFGISIISFFLISAAPGGPVEQALRSIKFSQSESASVSTNTESEVTAEVMESLKRQYGYDKPILTRYFIWLKKLATLDFGDSFVYNQSVWSLIVEKFPVSLMFGLVSFLLSYLISIPLGIVKALWNGSKFDTITSFLIFLTYATPSFILAILLIVFLGPGHLDWFPIQGLVSENYEFLSVWEKISDRISHAFLPLLCFTIGDFAALTVLTKNSILEEIHKDYIRTARAKGLGPKTAVFKHALRNALLPVATGLGGVLGVFFAGAFLLETIFNLDGIGLLSYNAIMQRDYNVIMGLLMLQSFAGLFGNILSDLIYVLLDARIDFSAQSS